MRSKILRTSLIATLSLAGCAGTPPKLERPVKYYGGVPEMGAMCRNTKKNLAAWLKGIAQHEFTRANAEPGVEALLAPDDIECIRADAKEFAALVGVPADDLRVLLQYQENLLYNCEKWKQ